MIVQMTPKDSDEYLEDKDLKLNVFMAPKHLIRTL